MTRTLIAIAAGSALALTAPLAAQNSTQPSPPMPPSAPGQTTTPQLIGNAAAAADPKTGAQPADTNADPKAKPKADTATCTPITAGPNQGEFIGKCKHRRF